MQYNPYYLNYNPGYAPNYMGAKRRYRAGGAEPREMFEGLEMMMKHITMLVEDLYKESDSEEERRIMDKYIKRIADIR